MRIVARGVYANVFPKQLALDPHCFDWEKDALTPESAKLVDSLVAVLQMYMRMHERMKNKKGGWGS